MKVDKAFLKLLDEMYEQLGVDEYGPEIINLFKTVYTEGKTIQQATLELINILFGEYGLVVLIPDNIHFKKLFKPTVENELREQFSHKNAQSTLKQLQQLYNVQVQGRELNLFYLKDDKRERLEIDGARFKIESLNLQWSTEEILEELENHPEHFSPNVILRGLLQESILPNAAFIGGGAEIAYWLELKNVFETANVPFPVLILRNSFLIIEEKWKNLLEHLDIPPENIFHSEHELLKSIVSKKSSTKISLKEDISQIEKIYYTLAKDAASINQSLEEHAHALKTKAIERLHELEKKMLRAEKRKFSDTQRQIKKLKSHLFPNNELQERVENFSGFYAKHGKEIIEIMFRHSRSLEQQFGIIDLT